MFKDKTKKTWLSMAIATQLSLTAATVSANETTPSKAGALCPQTGWSEGLAGYLDADAPMPSSFQASADDCQFNQWSWEAFVWATAKVNGVPRFMTLRTPDELLSGASQAAKKGLRLSSRSAPNHGASPFTEGAGAFVQADGSMLVGLNGYPVYASVHMNDSYFATAKKNMIKGGGYTSNAGKDYFSVGAGVIKATWFRFDDAIPAPEGAYITEAEVPVLTRVNNGLLGSASVVVKKDSQGNDMFETVQVALVGVHVVGYVQHHPEFLWGTFEHKQNAPMIKDNTFTKTGSDSNSYTFYTANTSYKDVLAPNQPNTSSDPAILTFDDATGKFSPVTQVVQMNRTGGDNRTNGPENIAAINTSAQGYLSTPHFDEPAHFNLFANYNLIGTVWMNADTYTRSTSNWKNLGSADAQGAVNLANSTAETFMQVPTNTGGPKTWSNCFTCHNPKSFTYGDKGAPALPARRIGISHIISEGTKYAVPNSMPVKPTSLPPTK